VEVANLFIALVPEQTHKETGKLCNYAAWLSRGWCRAELWCHLLSNKSDTSVVVVYSATEAEYMFPLDWQHSLISEGEFTVESDRATVVRLGEMAVESKIKHLSISGPLPHFRFFLAFQPSLLGKAREVRKLEDFLRDFRFSSLENAVQETSQMTAILCAVFAGDIKIVRLLAANKADVNLKLRGLGDLGYFDTQTPLMAAAKSRQEPEMLTTLIHLRADMDAVSRFEINCAYLARTPEHVKVLAEAKADFGLQRGWVVNGPAGFASTATVAAMLEHRCDPNFDFEAIGTRYGPLHAVVVFARANRHACATARLLLENRANVNARARPQGWFRRWCTKSQVAVATLGYSACSTQTRFQANCPQITPLGMASLVGHEELTRLFLDFGADLLPNERGAVPEDLAAMNGHTHLLPLLATFST